MKFLEYEIKNMVIQRLSGDKTALISGAVNYFGFHFSFDEDFSSIPGVKSVEISKNRQSQRIDLVEGKCAIPNDLLKDKNAIEFRVLSGNTIATPWVSIGITESGIIMPQSPEEEPEVGMEYVKTYTGDNSAPMLRATTNGLEYSQDGENWISGVSGVPEVPSRPKNAAYLRKNGDWVDAEEYLAKNGGEVNVIDEVKVNGEALPVENKSINIDLSSLKTLTGDATNISALDYSTTDIPTIVLKVNEIITALQARGIAT